MGSFISLVVLFSICLKWFISLLQGYGCRKLHFNFLELANYKGVALWNISFITWFSCRFALQSLVFFVHLSIGDHICLNEKTEYAFVFISSMAPWDGSYQNFEFACILIMCFSVLRTYQAGNWKFIIYIPHSGILRNTEIPVIVCQPNPFLLPMKVGYTFY